MALFANEGRYDDYVRMAHASFPTVPEAVIKGIIAAESGFKPDAVRGEAHLGDASYGLMQILLQTAKSLGYRGDATQLMHPGVNVYYGTKLLAENFKRAGNWPDAISAYNGGFRPELGFGKRATRLVRVCLRRDAQGNCEQWQSVNPGEYANKAYVAKVLGYMDRYDTQPLKPAGSSAATPTTPPKISEAGVATTGLIGVLAVLGLGLAMLRGMHR
jgi:soluble lytic murein transglycosylase-like protein